MKVHVSSIRKSHIFTLLVFILMGIIATYGESDIRRLMINVVGWTLILLGLFIGKLTMGRISTAIKGSKLYDDHPHITRILKGVIFGCIFSIVILLPFHYLYITYFDDIHEEYIVASSDSTGFGQFLFFFLRPFILGVDTPPEATHQTPALSYFLPTILAWIMIGGILAYLRIVVQEKNLCISTK